jgi:hypothetical protein
LRWRPFAADVRRRRRRQLGVTDAATRDHLCINSLTVAVYSCEDTGSWRCRGGELSCHDRHRDALHGGGSPCAVLGRQNGPAHHALLNRHSVKLFIAETRKSSRGLVVAGGDANICCVGHVTTGSCPLLGRCLRRAAAVSWVTAIAIMVVVVVL